MTSLASMLGLVPMAIGLGHGAEANIPLGRSVIGGQLLSTTLTLFIVPMLFRMLYRRPTEASVPEAEIRFLPSLIGDEISQERSPV